MEALRLSLHRMLKEYSPLLSGSTEKAVEKDIKYETELSKERVWDGSALDQTRVDEMLKTFTAQGSEGYILLPSAPVTHI
jgi:hypothetical protein